MAPRCSATVRTGSGNQGSVDRSSAQRADHLRERHVDEVNVLSLDPLPLEPSQQADVGGRFRSVDGDRLANEVAGGLEPLALRRDRRGRRDRGNIERACSDEAHRCTARLQDRETAHAEAREHRRAREHGSRSLLWIVDHRDPRVDALTAEEPQLVGVERERRRLDGQRGDVDRRRSGRVASSRLMTLFSQRSRAWRERAQRAVG
jgi:hypothetical protein